MENQDNKTFNMTAVQPAVMAHAKELAAQTFQIEKPVSVKEWFWLYFLAAVPGLNIIMFIIWSLKKDINESKKNWAKASLIIFVSIAVVTFLLGGIIWAFLASSINLEGLKNSFPSLEKFTENFDSVDLGKLMPAENNKTER